MRAFQLVAWQKPPELREVPVPEQGPGQILVKVGGAGACHSDLHLGADEGLLSGDAAVKRIKDMTRGQGANLVIDMVGVNPTLQMAAQVARTLGHLTIVGLGGGALPVNFYSPPHECSVASPYWGSITELMEVVSLAQAGKIRMLVEHFPLERVGEAYQLLHGGKINGRAVITPNG